MMNTNTTDETRKIRVFQDSPEWANRKWFTVPMHIIQKLHVCTYEVSEDYFDESLKTIEAQHPGCVFVY